MIVRTHPTENRYIYQGGEKSKRSAVADPLTLLSKREEKIL